jgi:hypothetical protein
MWKNSAERLEHLEQLWYSTLWPKVNGFQMKIGNLPFEFEWNLIELLQIWFKPLITIIIRAWLHGFKLRDATLATCQPSRSYPQAPARHTPGPPVATSKGSLVPGKYNWSRVLVKRWHLMHGVIGRNHRSPRASDDGHSSTEIRPVTTWHRNSSIVTRVISMITLTPNKFTLVKACFSIRDLVHHGPRWSTPRRIAWPGGFAPPSKAIYNHVTPPS